MRWTFSSSIKLATIGLTLVAVLPTVSLAQHDQHADHQNMNRQAGPPSSATSRPTAQMNRQVEPVRSPMGYQQVVRPQGADQRPREVDRQAYNHNFQADHGFRIGPYHAPRGYRYRRWAYGEVLPSIFWSTEYQLTDYWLFGLDVPPYGFEWVRYGPDALLVNVYNGEVVQVIYGRFE